MSTALHQHLDIWHVSFSPVNWLFSLLSHQMKSYPENGDRYSFWNEKQSGIFQDKVYCCSFISCWLFSFPRLSSAQSVGLQILPMTCSDLPCILRPSNCFTVISSSCPEKKACNNQTDLSAAKHANLHLAKPHKSAVQETPSLLLVCHPHTDDSLPALILQLHLCLLLLPIPWKSFSQKPKLIFLDTSSVIQEAN